MEEKLKSRLELVYSEYIEYKNFLKEHYKPQEQLRNEIIEQLKTETDTDNLLNLFFEKAEKQAMYQADFIKLQNRLFHTIEDYDDLIEIPQEIKEEVKNMKFTQIFKIKNGKDLVVDKDLVDAAKETIKNNIETLTKYFKQQEVL